MACVVGARLPAAGSVPLSGLAVPGLAVPLLIAAVVAALLEELLLQPDAPKIISVAIPAALRTRARVAARGLMDVLDVVIGGRTPVVLESFSIGRYVSV